MADDFLTTGRLAAKPEVPARMVRFYDYGGPIRRYPAFDFARRGFVKCAPAWGCLLKEIAARLSLRAAIDSIFAAGEGTLIHAIGEGR